MAKITKEELRRIARMSQVGVREDELDELAAQLDAVLTYAERVKEVASQVDDQAHKAVNVWRQDLVIRTNPEPILADAPEHEAHYFVVPKILDNV
jgi:aspartyl-tRNA(Asn)/glutamyl-tRNA(Gln) amidotransferase subunit C